MSAGTDDRVSRRKFDREVNARQQAESLLEDKSRELYFANQKLSAHSEQLEATVLQRTAELQDALIQAEAASAMRSRFVATMSHEIRTPLGGLLGMIDLLLGDETDPVKREYLEYSKVSGQALKRIVNDVLDFSKMEAGAFQFENEEVDIRALINGVIAMAKMTIGDGESRLSAEISSEVPGLFAGDATRIRQVISNLVSNAGRYSSDGPIAVRATAKPHEKGALVRVEVEDRPLWTVLFVWFSISRHRGIIDALSLIEGCIPVPDKCAFSGRMRNIGEYYGDNHTVIPKHA